MCVNSEVLYGISRTVSFYLGGLAHPARILPSSAGVPRAVCPDSGRPPRVGVCLWTLGKKGAERWSRLCATSPHTPALPGPAGPCHPRGFFCDRQPHRRGFLCKQMGSCRPVTRKREMKVKCAECIIEHRSLRLETTAQGRRRDKP